PKSQNNISRQYCKKAENEYTHLISGKQNEIRAQNSCNGSAGSETRQRRMKIECDKRKAGRDSAQNVNDQKAEMSPVILHVISEDVQIEHVSDDMHPAAVHEHRSE